MSMFGQSTISAASVLKISDEKTMQLIDLYYNEECLWNTKSVDYKNREKRNLAAEKIATILDLPNFTAMHVLMKFKNLRNSYSQEQKKIAQSIDSGATGTDVYQPKVFWYSKMDSFIKPHIRQKKENSLISRLDGNIEELVDDTGQAAEADAILAEQQHSASDEERSSDSLRKRVCKPVTKLAPRKVEQKLVSQALKDIQSQLNVLISHNEDFNDSFGKYVVSLLKTLPPKKALALQPRIVALITEEMEKNGGEADDELIPEFHSSNRSHKRVKKEYVESNSCCKF